MEPSNTKGRIQAVALDLFGSRGYELTSLREIAEEVGISKASLYYHFPSKQALLLSLLEPFVADWRETVAATERLPHTPANVRLALDRCLAMMLRHRPVCEMLVRRDAAAVLAHLAPLVNELIDLGTRMHTWLAGPQPTARDRLRAMAAVEVLGVVLSSTAVTLEIAEAELHQTLLDTAVSILGLRRSPADRTDTDIDIDTDTDTDTGDRVGDSVGEAVEEPVMAPVSAIRWDTSRRVGRA